MSIEQVLYFPLSIRNDGRKFYACHRTSSVFFFLGGENSMRDLAGVLFSHITGALGLRGIHTRCITGSLHSSTEV